MLRTIYDKFCFVSSTAAPIWAGLIEPNSARSQFQPLHTTLFSVNALQYTRFYHELPVQFYHPRPDLLIQQPLEFLAKGVDVLFYKAQPWFGDNRNELKRYAQWCEARCYGNYQVGCIVGSSSSHHHSLFN